jgi:hypothetical protein
VCGGEYFIPQTLETISGKTFAKKAEKETAEITYDLEFQDKLWEKTLKLLSTKD